jgi:hypothetical protein
MKCMKYAILLVLALFTFGCDKKIHEANVPLNPTKNTLTLNAPPAQLPPA